jgi:molybdopterin converting factor small subunit
MQVTVRFLAGMRHVTGKSECVLNVPYGASIGQLVDSLLGRYPGLESHRASWHFAVNQTHADEATRLCPGDTVAIFPYIAGG